MFRAASRPQRRENTKKGAHGGNMVSPVKRAQRKRHPPNGIRTRATALKGPRPGPLVDGGRFPRGGSSRIPAVLVATDAPGYRNIIQRAVAPHAQSLCFERQLRQSQCSHQIHLRWFTSSTKRATIQRRVCVCDTLVNVSADRVSDQWAARPNVSPPRSYVKTGRSGPRRSRPTPTWWRVTARCRGG